MRPVAYLLSLMLLGIGALAQDAAQQSSNDPSDAKTRPGVRVPLSDEEFASSLAAEDNTCYTMRTYFFRPSEDGTVEPAGMTTCVKSNQRALKRAQKEFSPEPSVRLVH